MNKNEYLEQTIYFQETDDEFMTVPRDEYFVQDGKTYKRFYKGQEIPADVWRRFFGKVEKAQPIEEPVQEAKEELTTETPEAEDKPKAGRKPKSKK